MILLYSSDYHPVYKRDIFAVSSLPDKYCYHFRYEKKYVSQAIIDGSLNPEGRRAIVIFVAGNTKTNTDYSFVPIRLATIVKMFCDPNTNLYHVYFVLESFIELIDEASSFDEKPQSVYFGSQVCEPKYKVVTWIEVIKKLNPYGNGFFFNVRIENNDKSVVSPKFDVATFEPFFQLTEGTNYFVRISISDSNQNKEENEIQTKIEGTDIKSNIGDRISSGLPLDDRSYKLAGLILGDINSSVNMLKISTLGTPLNAKNDYGVRLMFEVKKDVKRFRGYFSLSILVFLGAGLIALDLSDDCKSFWIRMCVKGVGLVFAAYAAAELFFRFNKK